MVDLRQHLVKGSTEFDAIARSLQGNILQSHRRSHAAHILIDFGDMPAADIATIVCEQIAEHVTSARQQLQRRRDQQANGHSTLADAFVGFSLSAAGYRKLGLAMPTRRSPFSVGMGHRAARLNDRSPDLWEAPFNNGRLWDALLVVAHDDPGELDSQVTMLTNVLPTDGFVNISGIVIDSTGAPGRQAEHFGFVDGLSNPVLLSDGSIQFENWDPMFPMNQALVPDPHGERSDSPLGSFLVFRQLRQHVDMFNDTSPGASNVVGRQPDGKPLVPPSALHENDFSYQSDPPSTAKCPVDSHIRKTNPRRPEDRSVQFARRGIPYGKTGDDDVGLLFMGYCADLEAQFETMQRSWIRNPNFPETATGVDALLITDFIELLGGEYFFTPSISMLRNLTHSTKSTNPAPAGKMGESS